MDVLSSLKKNVDKKLVKMAEMMYAPAYEFGVEYVAPTKDGGRERLARPIIGRKDSFMRTVIDSDVVDSVLGTYEMMLQNPSASDPEVFVYFRHGSKVDLKSKLAKVYNSAIKNSCLLDEVMKHMEKDVSEKMEALSSSIKKLESHAREFSPAVPSDDGSPLEIAEYAEGIMNSRLIEIESLYAKRAWLRNQLETKRAEYPLLKNECKRTMQAVDLIRNAIEKGNVVDDSLIPRKGPF